MSCWERYIHDPIGNRTNAHVPDSIHSTHFSREKRRCDDDSRYDFLIKIEISHQSAAKNWPGIEADLLSLSLSVCMDFMLE